jgi:heme-degrading monooxygenase HmoA
MIGLFFEVQTRPGRMDQYLNLAASLKPELEAMGGCLFIDRFKSLTRENLLVSYQIWQDEGALTAWRVHAHHHEVQTVGRERVFSDYRIRIAQLIHEAQGRDNRFGNPSVEPHTMVRHGVSRPMFSRRNRSAPRFRWRPNGVVMPSKASTATGISPI